MSMFDFVHKHKVFAQIVLGLIILSFLGFGVGAFVTGLGKSVATFDGGEVSPQEYAQILEERINIIKQRQPNFDMALLETPEFREILLQSLVDEKIFDLEVRKQRLYFSDEVLEDLIVKSPYFQVEGQYSQTAYEQYLAQNRLTHAGNLARLRAQIGEQLLKLGLSTIVMSDRVIDKMMNDESQIRNVDSVDFRIEEFIPNVTLTAEEVKTFYDENKAQYQQPEEIKVEYVILTPDIAPNTIEVDQKEIADYYKRFKNTFSMPERRDLRHILISVAPDADEATEQQALRKIEDLLAQVRQDPSRFSSLAAEFSEDGGSAENGGQYKDITLGGGFVAPFENALFALQKPGDISDPVRTDYGYHIILLDDIHPGQTRSIEAVSDDIRLRLAEEKASKLIQQRNAEFSDLIYGRPDTFKDVSEAFGLEVYQTDWLSQDTLPNVPPLTHPKLASILFDPAFIAQKYNSEAVEISPNIFVSARVIDNKPAEFLPFEEVRGLIESQLTNQKAEKMAVEAGENLLAALKENPNYPVNWTAQGDVSRYLPSLLPESSINAVMRANTVSLPERPAFTGALTSASYSVFRINEVKTPAFTEVERENIKNNFQQDLIGTMAVMVDNAYISALRSRYDVNIRKDRLEAFAKDRVANY